MSVISSLFGSKANETSLSSSIDQVRRGLRDLAKLVRWEAAWRGWPGLHGAAKSLHERLTTDQDRSAERESHLRAYAERTIWETAGSTDQAEIDATIAKIVEGKVHQFTVAEVRAYLRDNIDGLLPHTPSDQRQYLLSGARRQFISADTKPGLDLDL